jgi:predicted MFS family arabinose efflux permease
MGAEHHDALRRGRVAVYLLFLVGGTAIGTWTARIPAIKHGLGLTDGQLSLGLLGLAAGAITGMQVVGRLVDRYGSARVMVPAALVEGAVLIPPAYAPNLGTLAVALFAFGAVHGTLNIAMNANAVRVERAWGRPLLSSFHAAYSIGGFVGAAVGGLFAYADLGAAATFVTVAVLVAVLALGAASWAWSPVDDRAGAAATTRLPGAGSQPGAVPKQRSPASTGADRRMPGVGFLGLLAFCALVGEGAAADWSTVYLRDSLGSSAGFAAAAYAAFSVAMTAGRLVGDRLTTALGPVRLVRGCGMLAAVGLGAALLIDHPVAGVLGFGCFGAGLSCIAPQAFSAAGNRHPDRAGAALARVASLGYLGFLTGPVLIGGAAELIGLPRALVIPVLLAVFVAGTATALRHRRVAIPVPPRKIMGQGVESGASGATDR